jgi:hypothetical protein
MRVAETKYPAILGATTVLAVIPLYLIIQMLVMEDPEVHVRRNGYIVPNPLRVFLSSPIPLLLVVGGAILSWFKPRWGYSVGGLGYALLSAAGALPFFFGALHRGLDGLLDASVGASQHPMPFLLMGLAIGLFFVAAMDEDPLPNRSRTKPPRTRRFTQPPAASTRPRGARCARP